MSNYPQMTTTGSDGSMLQSMVNYDHFMQSNSGSNIPTNIRQNSVVMNGFTTNQNNDNLISVLDQLIINQNNLMNKLNVYCKAIVKDLNEFGFCLIDNFLNNGSEDQVLSEVHSLYESGLFSAGQLVNNKAINTKMIRGDHIIWIEGNEQMCPNICFLIQYLESIVMKCNTYAAEGQFTNYRISRRTKAMIACFPGKNAKYVRHIDNPNNDGRCLTSIYYLNKDYNRQRDGGVLRLFPQKNTGIVADIEPIFDRLLFFWSDRRNPHEVMPSNRLRFAITVWYYDENERERALQKYNEHLQSQIS